MTDFLLFTIVLLLVLAVGLLYRIDDKLFRFLPTQQPPSPTDRVERTAGDAGTLCSGGAQATTRIDGPGVKP